MTRTTWTKERFEEIYDEFLDGAGGTKNKRTARILKAATELFMTQGYRKTSVEEIARRAHVAKGTVYLHFKNKADLLMHALGLEERVLIERLSPVLDGELPEPEHLRFFVRLLLTVARELPLVASLMRGENEMLVALEELDPSVMARLTSAGEDWIASLIERAAPDAFGPEELRERANLVMTLYFFTGLLTDETVRGGRSLDEFAETMADVIVYGLAHRPPRIEDRSERANEDEG